MPFSVLAADLTIGMGVTSTSGDWSLGGKMTADSFSGNGAGLTSIDPSHLSNGTAGISITGNAATATTASSVANGVYTTGTYVNPTWITSLDGSKITGDISGNNLILPATSATAGQIKLGGSLFIHDYGTRNTFVGNDAGNFSMSGTDNTTSGYGGLNHNTTGYQNTATGSRSLLFNSTGSDNTANGYASLYYNSIGNDNTAIGLMSLYYNTTASGNTAVGSGALYTQSYSNSGTVWESDNTAVGFQALYFNQPALNINGLANTAVGAYSLYSNITGDFNTASGSESLYSNTTGFFNTASGSESLSSNTTGFGNTASGSGSLGANTKGSENTASGDESLNCNTLGSSNTAFGGYAGQSNTIGNFNTFIGASANAAAGDVTDATAVGSNALVDASYRVRIGDTYVTQIGGQVGWSNLSDVRAKKDIRDIPFGIDFIKSLRPVEFRMKNGNKRMDFGFIAQDIEALLGDGYNVLGIGGDADRTLSLRYTDFIAPMVKAMQEQQTIIESQQTEIENLKVQVGEMDVIKERLARLEALVGIK